MGDYIVRGKLHAEWWVRCGDCGTSDYVDDGHMTAVAKVKQEGWRHTKRYGWLCPKCEKEHREHDSQNADTAPTDNGGR